MSKRHLHLVGVAVLVVSALATFLAAGCGSPAAVPTSLPTAAAATGAAVAPTVSAAATSVAPTTAAAVPTVSAAATSAAPTVSAASTSAAPTVSAAATALAPAAGTVTASAAGQLSDAGKAVYAENCASCHGANGEGGVGPALIGANANLAKYDTAQGLYTKISTTMPRNRPGSLTQAQYLQVTAFLLIQNNLVQPTAPLGSATLGGVPLKK